MTTDITTKDKSRSNIKTERIKSERHKPKYDADSINRAIDKAIRNENFLNDALKSLVGLQFPAYKRDIINYVNLINSSLINGTNLLSGG